MEIEKFSSSERMRPALGSCFGTSIDHADLSNIMVVLSVVKKKSTVVEKQCHLQDMHVFIIIFICNVAPQVQ